MCARAADGHWTGLAKYTRTTTYFVYERLKLHALVVPNDDSARLQFVGELLRHVVVKRVHQASPLTSCAWRRSSAAINGARCSRCARSKPPAPGPSRYQRTYSSRS